MKRDAEELPDLSQDEINMLKKYRSLNMQQHHFIISLIKIVSPTCKKKDSPVRYIGESIMEIFAIARQKLITIDSIIKNNSLYVKRK